MRRISPRMVTWCPRCLRTIRPQRSCAAALARCRSCRFIFRLPVAGHTVIELLRPWLAPQRN